MTAHIICVGKVKERHYAMACDEYLKRLGRYGKVDVRQLADEPCPANPSAKDIERLVAIEGRRVLEEIKKTDVAIALAVAGERLSSESFAAAIERMNQNGRLCFIIGGSYGLSPDVLKRADRLLSVSDMTLPHQLCRVVLLEQLYRAATILAGHKYNK